ncbi:SMAD/FHA domain-containing protein [Striga hermonthica]|uniref:SMAD/FHA domain-containing protein n=1 Tax=Striga hermonthica TaxID=68872 RepID=A0A9N7N4L9_STRHE|nr:SMAD/FHA domain-containing protein [Striga hermonthica]
MEVVSQDGTRIRIDPGQTRELGRTHGLSSVDKTISRRQISFSILLAPNVGQETLLQFEVLGRNPIYVSQGGGVKIFRRFERGEMRDGDMFCVSAKNPVWYAIRKIDNGDVGGARRNDPENELGANLESVFDSRGFEDMVQSAVDVLGLDPVKEFGFLAIGHEFDSYPVKMIRDIKQWDWFLEEAKKDIDDEDEDEGKTEKRSSRRKRKKGTENDDEDWSAESEDDKVIVHKSRKSQKPKYMTRSKDRGKNSKKEDGSKRKSPTVKETREIDDDEEDEDEDDETLGGFIVDDENLEDEEEIRDEEEDEIEEEELVDEDEDDEDNEDE